MADVQYTHGMGAPGFAHRDDTSIYRTAPEGGNTLKTLTHLTGAALSLALLVGVGIWGYKLVARDVSGIPVVRAAEGEMRVRPADPGGQLAQNTGLAVNQVAALGTAAAPADTLRLAPEPVDLEPGDVERAPVLQAPVAPSQQPVEASLRGQSVENIVAALTDGVEPIEPVAQAPIKAPAPVEVDPAEAAAEPAQPEATAEPAVLSGPGMNLSLRPVARPAAAPAVVVPARSAPEPASTDEIDPETLQAGTRLAQLGAYESAEVARSEWGRMSGRFGSYLAGKERVVQRAQSGGRTFYRLRAHGFTDLAAARRFCAALVAEGQDCIPVVTR